jgi:hypothetical protein
MTGGLFLQVPSVHEWGVIEIDSIRFCEPTQPIMRRRRRRSALRCGHHLDREPGKYLQASFVYLRHALAPSLQAAKASHWLLAGAVPIPRERQ